MTRPETGTTGDARLRGTVLVVDDDEEVTRFVTRFARQRFPMLRVVTAPDGPSALDLLASVAPDVVISDQVMPGMDGVTLLAAIRARRPQAARILLTGFPDTSLAIRAVNEGHVDAFLRKPLTGELAEKLRSALAVASERGARTSTPEARAHGDVLIVDDDREICDLVAAYVGQKLPGVHVHKASTAKDGLVILAKHHVDVILADYHLPDMSGSSFLAEARRDFPDARRVLITGSPEEGLALGTSSDHSAERFFIKPVDMAAFTRTIQKLLPRS